MLSITFCEVFNYDGALNQDLFTYLMGWKKSCKILASLMKEKGIKYNFHYLAAAIRLILIDFK